MVGGLVVGRFILLLVLLLKKPPTIDFLQFVKSNSKVFKSSFAGLNPGTRVNIKSFGWD